MARARPSVDAGVVIAAILVVWPAVWAPTQHLTTQALQLGADPQPFNPFASDGDLKKPPYVPVRTQGIWNGFEIPELPERFAGDFIWQGKYPGRCGRMAMSDAVALT